jgi:two-component system NtrC family sensor kinase
MPIRAMLMLPARLEALLLELSTNPAVDEGDLVKTHRLVLKTVADGLRVARVGIWTFDDHRDVMRCLALADSAHKAESEDAALDRATYPRYFAALDTERAIVAHDARIDPSTSEFAEGYLKPLGITSMLDVPVRQHGRMVGIICSEHVGPARAWHSEEAAFAAAVADLLGRAMTAARFRADVKSLVEATREHTRRLSLERDALQADVADLAELVQRLHGMGAGPRNGVAEDLAEIAERLRRRAESLDDGASGLESRAGALEESESAAGAPRS